MVVGGSRRLRLGDDLPARWKQAPPIISLALLQLSKKYIYGSQRDSTRVVSKIYKKGAESRIALICAKGRRCLYVFDNSSGLFSMHVLIQLSREKTHASPPNYNIAPRSDLHRVKSHIGREREKKNGSVCVYILCHYIPLSWGCERGQSRLFLCATLAVFTPDSSSFLFLFCAKPLGNFKQIYIYESTWRIFPFHVGVCERAFVKEK